MNDISASFRGGLENQFADYESETLNKISKVLEVADSLKAEALPKVQIVTPAITGVEEAQKSKNTTNYGNSIVAKSRPPAEKTSTVRAAGATILRMSPTAKRSQREAFVAFQSKPVEAVSTIDEMFK